MMFLGLARMYPDLERMIPELVKMILELMKMIPVLVKMTLQQREIFGGPLSFVAPHRPNLPVEAFCLQFSVQK